jgi:uncharacterized damage-inducible protein DinB
MERVAVELIDGRGAHADPLACIDDLSAEQAARKPAGFEHSIFEILAHLNYWMDYDLKRMNGTPAPYPAHAAEGWPSCDEAEESDWRREVARFQELTGELASMCRRDEAAWLTEAPAMCEGHKRNASAIGAMIFQAITHNSYHMGQIVDIRRALGAWPPAHGGDAW